jgi:hypothetical protein
VQTLVQGELIAAIVNRNLASRPGT